jgi:hypothetical protein
VRRAAAAAAAALAAAALPGPGPAGARELPLALPLACDLGGGCYIQQYVDRDPGPGVADFTCGPLSYDGHTGTDFALPTLAAMRRGVAVLAAAPGRVVRLRDGMPDAIQGAPGAPDVEGRGCGNGVVIDHGGGWETQYCHLAQGSVAVVEGQRVGAGARLGLVGLSGATEFPHLEFIVRRDGRVIDPFDAANDQSCGGVPEPLWRTPPAYRPGGFLDAGIAGRVPGFDELKAGLPTPARLAPEAPLVAWALLFGGRAGDVVAFALDGPAGPVHRDEAVLERTQAQLFRASGRRAPPGGWPEGSYRARIALVRDGIEIESRLVEVTVAR